jgi:hypothetical protein
MDVNFSELPKVRLERMRAVGEEALECYRVLSKAGANIVGELLKGEGTFYEWNHYPDGDIYDNETHSQYYYHAHREEEHGHFHTFVRHSGMPDGMIPVENSSGEDWPEGDERLSHLIAISVDPQGLPLALFTTNRWVTGENWYAADDVIRLLDRFEIDHAVPNWATNRWLTAIIRLFHPQIVELVKERDRAIAEWTPSDGTTHVFDDRDLEITSNFEISPDEQLENVRAALGKTA